MWETLPDGLGDLDLGGGGGDDSSQNLLMETRPACLGSRSWWRGREAAAGDGGRGAPASAGGVVEACGISNFLSMPLPARTSCSA